MDWIVRWGGVRRLNGFLLVQSVNANFYGRNEYWPDYEPQYFEQALAGLEIRIKHLAGNWLLVNMRQMLRKSCLPMGVNNRPIKEIQSADMVRVIKLDNKRPVGA